MLAWTGVSRGGMGAHLTEKQSRITTSYGATSPTEPEFEGSSTPAGAAQGSEPKIEASASG
jgi:hypothetical protein